MSKGLVKGSEAIRLANLPIHCPIQAKGKKSLQWLSTQNEKVNKLENLLTCNSFFFGKPCISFSMTLHGEAVAQFSRAKAPRAPSPSL